MDQFKHLYINKKSSKTFLLLHGTGGNENDLIPIAQELDATYSILSLRGNVKEHGMNRFFERYPDGTFDQDSIKEESVKLHTFLTLWLKEQNRTFDDLIWLGYSNGANFALSFLFRYPDLVNQVVLFHPMIPFKPNENTDLSKMKIYMTYGKRDYYLTAEEFEELKKILDTARAKVTTYQHNGGHEIQEEELMRAKEFFAS